MDPGFSIIAGLVQGVTEFLPISSTAHLTLLGHFGGVVDKRSPAEWTAYIALLQMGTLLAVLLFFRSTIVEILHAFFRENLLQRRAVAQQSLQSRMGWMVVIGTLPVGILGLLFKDVIEGPWTKDLTVIAIAQIAFSLLLLLAEKTSRHTRSAEDATWKDALIVGIGQACALIPGASRSGTTLTAALLTGITRSEAARFSFLLSIPAVFLSGMLELATALPSITWELSLSYLSGIAAAFVSGYASIAFLIRYLQKNSTSLFIAYRILLGTGLLIAIATERIVP